VLHVLPEVLDDDLGLLADVVLVQAHEFAEGFRRFLLGQLFVLARPLLQLIERLVSHVLRQHVEDEALFDSLAHAVGVERFRHAARALASE